MNKETFSYQVGTTIYSVEVVSGKEAEKPFEPLVINVRLTDLSEDMQNAFLMLREKEND